MNPADIACVVLASGLSERFGPADKLAAQLCGQSVLSHVLNLTSEVGFGETFLVSQSKDLKAHAEISWVKNESPKAGQGHTLRLGLHAARCQGWTHCAVLLGDMPLVPLSHIKQLIAAYAQTQSVISINQGTRLPPAIFRGIDVDKILAQKPTMGARDMFDQLTLTAVHIDHDAAVDVDTPEDLASVTRIMETRDI